MTEMRWADDVSLSGRNTLHVAARATAMCEVKSLDDLPEAFELAQLKNLPVLVLGEGSNVLFAGDYPGLVLCLTADDCRILSQDGNTALIRAEAGMRWNDLVNWTLARGWNGLENMALIPGTVGASPIQNIGAYGAEVAEFIETVEAFNRHTGQFKRLNNADCRFGYRDSRFKQELDEWVICAVEFRLDKNRPLKMAYAGVPEELTAMAVDNPTAVHLAEAISRIRTRKLPNPDLIGNAGSFFKNPVLADEAIDQFLQRYPLAPVFPSGQNGFRKLSAAWLIEQAGWKGFRDKDAGISAQHALVLVNYGSATGAELLAVADAVVDSVENRFGIRLQPEPRILGATSDSR
jgi:UDP-N-acetylmuramate dehydrogenase